MNGARKVTAHFRALTHDFLEGLHNTTKKFNWHTNFPITDSKPNARISKFGTALLIGNYLVHDMKTSDNKEVYDLGTGLCYTYSSYHYYRLMTEDIFVDTLT
jgi:hypothetical protein